MTPQRKLHVGYMLPHHNLTGGMKCLVEHIRLLRARGHTTVALHRRAPDDWMLRSHITGLIPPTLCRLNLLQRCPFGARCGCSEWHVLTLLSLQSTAEPGIGDILRGDPQQAWHARTSIALHHMLAPDPAAW